jgi:hypothetical protein
MSSNRGINRQSEQYISKVLKRGQKGAPKMAKKCHFGPLLGSLFDTFLGTWPENQALFEIPVK